MELRNCLNRIEYTGTIDPTLDTLRGLHQAFMLTVPFENLDIHLGRKLSLYPERIYDKIVTKKRGGFCYECNILFYELLSSLGFRVEYLSARMVQGRTVGAEYDHMALNVHLENDYLADVGNGQSFREPLPMGGGAGSTPESLTYRIEPHDNDLALYYRKPDTAWRPRFLFSLIPRDRAEFSGMCRHHQTSPESIFTRHRIVTMALQKGRATLTGMRLTVTHGAEKETRMVTSDAEYDHILKHTFGITIDGS
ncbi:hypothetical protein D3OALGA1CA_433 [Olavius algarvensis associated proteobacterium Delta 3]|nr:hypothetical protein D3OALGA1CA_433 [Olavius algarvensis associated proteobacterium Delta 3]